MPTKTEPTIELRYLVSRVTCYARLEKLAEELRYREVNGKAHPAQASYDLPTRELVSQVVTLAHAFAEMLEDEDHQKEADEEYARRREEWLNKRAEEELKTPQ